MKGSETKLVSYMQGADKRFIMAQSLFLWDAGRGIKQMN